MRDEVISMWCSKANTFFAQASQKSGRQKEEALAQAYWAWLVSSTNGGVEALTTLCNLAALALQKKE